MCVAGKDDQPRHALLTSLQQIQYFLPRSLYPAGLDVSRQHGGAQVEHDDQRISPFDDRKFHALQTGACRRNRHQRQEQGGYPHP